MRLIRVLLLAVLAVVVFGCGGGGGGGGSTSDPLVAVFQRIFRNIENESLVGVMENYSFDFYNACQDYNDAEDAYDNLLEPDGLALDVRDIRFTYSEHNGSTGFVEGSFVIRATDGVDYEDFPYEISMEMILEDGVWRLYGDQQCNIETNDLKGKADLKKLFTAKE